MTFQEFAPDAKIKVSLTVSSINFATDSWVQHLRSAGEQYYLKNKMACEWSKQ